MTSISSKHFLISSKIFTRFVNSLNLPVVLEQEHLVLAYFLPLQLPVAPKDSWNYNLQIEINLSPGSIKVWNAIIANEAESFCCLDPWVIYPLFDWPCIPPFFLQVHVLQSVHVWMYVFQSQELLSISSCIFYIID